MIKFRPVCHCKYCQLNSSQKDIFNKIQSRLKNLLPKGVPLCFKKDQTIFYEGHLPYGFYILQKGKLALVKKSSPPTHIYDKQGDIIGLSHLITNTPFCKTCQPQDKDVEILFLPKSLIMGYLENSF